MKRGDEKGEKDGKERDEQEENKAGDKEKRRKWRKLETHEQKQQYIISFYVQIRSSPQEGSAGSFLHRCI